MARGSVKPSATNIGSTKCLGSNDVSATSRRRAGVERSRRGRCLGKATTSTLAATALLARRRQGSFGAQSGGMLGKRLDQRADRSGFRLHVDAQAELGGRLGRLGSDARDDGPRV